MDERYGEWQGTTSARRGGEECGRMRAQAQARRSPELGTAATGGDVLHTVLVRIVPSTEAALVRVCESGEAARQGSARGRPQISTAEAAAT